MKKIILFIIMLVSIISCGTSPREKLMGNWNFVNSIAKRQHISFEYHAFRSSIMFSKENFLFIDGGTLDVFNLSHSFTDTVAKSQTKVYFGSWILNEKDSLITLNVKNREQKFPLILSIKSVDEKNFLFVLNNTDNSDFNDYYTYNYKKSYDKTLFPENDFMSLPFNLWRIPSDKKESETMIANRIRESLNFALHFFKYHVDNDLTINTEYLNPLPIYFANNGIALEKSESWNHLFHDEEDVNVSYRILEGAFRASVKTPVELQKKALSASIFKIEELLKNIPK